MHVRNIQYNLGNVYTITISNRFKKISSWILMLNKSYKKWTWSPKTGRYFSKNKIHILCACNLFYLNNCSDFHFYDSFSLLCAALLLLPCPVALLSLLSQCKQTSLCVMDFPDTLFQIICSFFPNTFWVKKDHAMSHRHLKAQCFYYS